MFTLIISTSKHIHFFIWDIKNRFYISFTFYAKMLITNWIITSHTICSDRFKKIVVLIIRYITSFSCPNRFHIINNTPCIYFSCNSFSCRFFFLIFFFNFFNFWFIFFFLIFCFFLFDWFLICFCFGF